MEHYDEEEIVNVGVGEDLSIGELAALVREVVGYSGDIVFDTQQARRDPAQAPGRLAPDRAWGGRPTTGLREGIAQTYAWYVAHQPEVTPRPWLRT